MDELMKENLKNTAVKYARNYTCRGGNYHRISRHCYTVAAESVFPFEIIERIGKQRHEYICARQAADIFNKLPDKDYV